MKLAYYIKKKDLKNDERVLQPLGILRDKGFDVYDVAAAGGLVEGTGALLSFGGDGTFLTAAQLAAPAGVPIVGMNFGRLGFLSENRPEDVVESLVSGKYAVEDRELLMVGLDCAAPQRWQPLALNEMTVHRMGAAMLGVDVKVNGTPLPTYWADGLLVSTSSGSTAYSLSVGGPICTPDTKVLIIAPIAPHNLNVRPLIVPEGTTISLVPHSREESAVLTLDNRNYVIPAGTGIDVCVAPLRLRRLRIGESSFIGALRTRLHWGDDLRNGI
ncbi:MAG: NAD(+)/NADH kinase [Bacteroidales bacterium]|nr:NAD(+)/NADH kinase [Candidatus Cryptobacteroides choladohippi]